MNLSFPVKIAANNHKLTFQEYDVLLLASLYTPIQPKHLVGYVSSPIRILDKLLVLDYLIKRKERKYFCASYYSITPLGLIVLKRINKDIKRIEKEVKRVFKG